jgi:glycine cleavage system protein P-like pyridoxal-binding family
MSRLASDHTASPLIFELGQDGRANRYVDTGAPLTDFLPKNVLRDDLPLPDNSELEVVRHFTRLSQRTFGIDVGFYPLGSCTMKYNPRVNDAMANLPQLRDLHPYAPDELAQGALQIMWELRRSSLRKPISKIAVKRSGIKSSFRIQPTVPIRPPRRCAVLKSSRSRATSAAA